MSEQLTLGEIRARLSASAVEDYPLWLAWLAGDTRRGALGLCMSAAARWRGWLGQGLKERPLWEREAVLRRSGRWLLAGVDEAGRGPLAGPVVAAAVILPPGFTLPGLDDSKRIQPARRRLLYRDIRKRALALSVGVAGPRLIDRLNILRASLLAMRRAVLGLTLPPDGVLVDGAMTIPELGIPQAAHLGGDGLYASVAAASVVAKVYRDSLMVRYGQMWKGYGFERHRGYGTSEHMEALDRLGPCPIHRRSFLGGRAAVPEPDTRWAEDVAADHLVRSGARIVEQGYRCRWGRAALIVVDGEGPAVVEVRSGSASISPLRLVRLRRIARAWADKNGLDPAAVRCDLITVGQAAGPASAVRHTRGVARGGR